MKPRMHVVRLGEPDWPRFAIQRGRRRYWTGKTWCHCQDDALLFSEEQEAINQAIVLEDHYRPRRFVTTAVILVDCAEPLTIEVVQELLEHSDVSLTVEDKHDLNDLDIDINLDWRGLEEIR